jgi:hypothetical protein
MKDSLKSIFYCVIVLIISPLISVLFWRIFQDNYFFAIGFCIPVGLTTGIVFLIIDHFILKKRITEKIYLVRILTFIIIFIFANLLHLFIEKEEIIAPLMYLLNITSTPN